VTQVAAAAATMLLSVGVIGGQTVITPPPHRYSPSQDVELGRQAAAQVEQRLPILGDEEVTSSVASGSRRTGARCRAKNAVTFAPEGAYGNAGGQSVFTHGMQIGLARDDTHNLRTATDDPGMTGRRSAAGRGSTRYCRTCRTRPASKSASRSSRRSSATAASSTRSGSPRATVSRSTKGRSAGS